MTITLPLVTLAIPSYNSGDFLKYTLESVANQTMENFECIVVDDSSTDNSLQHFSSIVGKDPRFKLVKHKVNSGHAASRNTAIRMAKGRFMAFLDSDDLIMSNSLETRAATCLWGERTSDRYAGSYSASVAIDESERHPPEIKEVKLPALDWVSTGGICPFNANQPMIRTELLRRAGGFNENLSQSEDFDLWLRLLRAGYIFAPVNWSNVTYRKRRGSTIRKAPLTHLKTALELLNSSSAQLSDDQLVWSNYRYTMPLHNYTYQRAKMSRIFEFCGMSLSSSNPASTADLADIVLSELPDLHSIDPVEDRKRILINGVKRQSGQLTLELSGLIDELMEKLDKAQPASVAPKDQETPCVLPFTNPKYNAQWDHSLTKKYDIAFIPHKGYHVWTISLIKDNLINNGFNPVIVDISAQWRDGGVREAAEEHKLDLISLSDFCMGSYWWKNIIVFNDWDPVTRPILVAAQLSGIKTSAIVEGIQDYDDADVHWERHAYKTAETIFLPGEFDKRYFERHDVSTKVVGVPRIQSLRAEPRPNWQLKDTPCVLINSNFSYGVLEEHRDKWLNDAVEAVISLGMEPIISRHPGDTGTTHSEYVTTKTFYECLECCDVSIQRFASGILEALAKDVGVIYYNPHGEKVDKFQDDPMEAFTVAKTACQLRDDLTRWLDLRKLAKENGPAFLDHHSGMGDIDVSREMAAEIIADCSSIPAPQKMEAFREYLRVIDRITLSMTRCVTPNGPLFTDPKTAKRELERLYTEHYNGVEPKSVKLRAASQFSTEVYTGDSVSKKESVGERMPGRENTHGASLLALASELLLGSMGKLESTKVKSIDQLISEALEHTPADHCSRDHLERVRKYLDRRAGKIS